MLKSELFSMGESDGSSHSTFWFTEIIRIQRTSTARANRMRKVGLRMIADVRFNLMPIAFLVTNVLAAGADGQQPA